MRLTTSHCKKIFVQKHHTGPRNSIGLIRLKIGIIEREREREREREIAIGKFDYE